MLALAACSAKPPRLQRLSADDTILAFGDSLTYGTGAGEEESYPAQLAAITGRKVIKAGVPGEVTEEGLRRLPALLEQHKPKLLLLCMGGNDMLRKTSDEQTSANLKAMMQLARDRGIGIVLIGVPRPVLAGALPLVNSTPDFYQALAAENRLPYEGKALEAILFTNDLKSDFIHPNARGYRQLAESLAKLLHSAGAL